MVARRNPHFPERFPKDYREMLRILAHHRVRYLVIGGYAVIFHGSPRTTKDLDIWVDPSKPDRVFAALAAFGAPMKDYSPQDFGRLYQVLQIGVEPVRIDVLTSVAGVRFQTAWEKRKTISYEGQKIHVISRADLIRSKRAAGRGRDLDDIEALEGR